MPIRQCIARAFEYESVLFVTRCARAHDQISYDLKRLETPGNQYMSESLGLAVWLNEIAYHPHGGKHDDEKNADRERQCAEVNHTERVAIRQRLDDRPGSCSAHQQAPRGSQRDAVALLGRGHHQIDMNVN
jgi:hypothetical protein